MYDLLHRYYHASCFVFHSSTMTTENLIIKTVTSNEQFEESSLKHQACNNESGQLAHHTAAMLQQIKCKHRKHSKHIIKSLHLLSNQSLKVHVLQANSAVYNSDNKNDNNSTNTISTA